jgi:carboxylesterase
MSVDPGPFQLGDMEGNGPAVLCLHGLTGTPYEVRAPAEALTERGFACLGPLLPGHGEPADALARTEPESWIREATEAFDRLASTHKRVYALGLSLGGLLTLLLAARRPVAGLAVLAAPLRLRAASRVAAPLLARVIASVPKRPAIADPNARRRHPGTDRMPLRSVLGLMEIQREVERSLPSVTAPTHLIFSRRDPVVHPRNAERIKRALASSRCTVRYLERSAHVITVDHERDEVARECVSFFHRLEREGAGAAR